MPHFGFYIRTYFRLVLDSGSINYHRLNFLRSTAKIAPYAEIYCRPLLNGSTPLLERWENGKLVFRAPEYNAWIYATNVALEHTIIKQGYKQELIKRYAEEPITNACD